MEESDVWGSTTHTAVPERKGRDCVWGKGWESGDLGPVLALP